MAKTVKKAKPKDEAQDGEILTRADLFAIEYLVDFNGTQAAIRAGYAEGAAHVQATRLLRNDKVLSRIEAEQQRLIEARRKDAERLRVRIEDEIDADLADLFDDNTGALKPVREWPMAFRRGLVGGIEVQELYGEAPDGGGAKPVIGHVKKIKISDRLKRIELLGKHRDIFAWREKKAGDNLLQGNPLQRWREEVSGQRILPKASAGNPQKV